MLHWEMISFRIFKMSLVMVIYDLLIIQSKCSASSMAVTYITLKLHHVFGQFKAHGIRKHVVGMNNVPVVGIGGHFLGLFGCHHTEHVHWGMEGCLGFFITLLVFPV